MSNDGIFNPDGDEISEALAPIFSDVARNAKQRSIESAQRVFDGGEPEDIISSTFFTGMMFGAILALDDMAAARILLGWGMALCGWDGPPEEFVTATHTLASAAIHQASR